MAPANPYGTALGLDPVYTLAASFITSCPAANAPLPVKAFPALVATQGDPAAQGVGFTFSVAGSLPAEFWVTFCSGLNTTSVVGMVQGGMISTVVPETVAGQTYAFVTSEMAMGALVESTILYGPAILEVTPSSPTYDLTVE